MTTQDLIQQILAKHPQLSQDQIHQKLQDEKQRTCGLLGDETILRLIAARLGVEVQQNTFHNSGFLSTSRLYAGLNDVSVTGRLIAVFPAKTFQGAEKSGKFATLMLADNDGLLRVVLWNEKADLVESGELKAGQTVRLLHGYTREDRYGKTEMHLGGRSLIELQPPEKTSTPPIERFATKINTLNANSGNVHIAGNVKAVYDKKGFTRRDDADGVVLRLALRDDSGEVVAVVWNEKVEEVERLLRESPRLLLVNARVKQANSGSVEVHVDSNTFVSTQ